MDLYTSKQRWKLLLVVLALAVVGGSLFYSNQSIQKIGERERSKARQWALALRKKAELVELSSDIFAALEQKEREKMALVRKCQPHPTWSLRFRHESRYRFCFEHY